MISSSSLLPDISTVLLSPVFSVFSSSLELLWLLGYAYSLPGVVRGLVYLVWKFLSPEPQAGLSITGSNYGIDLKPLGMSLNCIFILDLLLRKVSFLPSHLPPQGLCPRLASVGYFYENDLELLKIILPPHLVHEVQKINRGKEFTCSGIKEFGFYSEQIRKQLECFKQRNSTLSDRIWWIVVGYMLRLEVSGES